MHCCLLKLLPVSPVCVHLSSKFKRKASPQEIAQALSTRCKKATFHTANRTPSTLREARPSYHFHIAKASIFSRLRAGIPRPISLPDPELQNGFVLWAPRKKTNGTQGLEPVLSFRIRDQNRFRDSSPHPPPSVPRRSAMHPTKRSALHPAQAPALQPSLRRIQLPALQSTQSSAYSQAVPNTVISAQQSCTT